MTLEEARGIIKKIKTDYGLGYVKTTEEEIGDQVKFINFSVSIKIDNSNEES